jgi:hypothetical protein
VLRLLVPHDVETWTSTVENWAILRIAMTTGAASTLRVSQGGRTRVRRNTIVPARTSTISQGRTSGPASHRAPYSPPFALSCRASCPGTRQPARSRRRRLRAARRIAASPRRRAAKPEARNAPAVAGSRSAGETISLDLKDADLKDVLRTFAELARLNIVIDPEVKGSVTVRLQDVPWDQALDVILQVNGLGYVLEGNVLRVGEPRKLIPPDVPNSARTPSRGGPAFPAERAALRGSPPGGTAARNASAR